MQNPPKTTEPVWTILKLVRWTTTYFQSHAIDSPRATAEILLAHTLNMNRIDLYLQFDQPIVSTELGIFRALIKRRIQREPVAYIVGTKEFWSLNLSVTDKVLIPRPETECLVEQALSLLPQADSSPHPPEPRRILEIGTGSGAITLALATERPTDYFLALDISLPAVTLAKRNAMDHDLAGKIDFFTGNLFAGIRKGATSFDMIVSNPPYIPTGTIDTLQPEITRYEPVIALDGHTDGLFFLRQIIGNAHAYLGPKGYLLLEIGHDQKDAVQQIITESNTYEAVVFSKDYSGHDRVVCMRKKA
ncbi:MAG: peptide chain release factor N(5)-glutamine methyltransferase [Desulfobacterales bacterium]